MMDSSLILQACLGGVGTVKRDLLHRSLASEFDIDYEMRLVLFLAAYIDGSVGAWERRFAAKAAEALEWSPMYHDLLVGKIEKQPSYQLGSLRLATQHQDFGRIVYKLGYSMASIDGPMKTDERVLISNLRDHLFATEPGVADTLDRELARLFEHDPIQPLGGGAAARPSLPQSATASTDPADLEACMKKLDDLIGIEPVKDEIKNLVSFLQIQKKRQEMNLAPTDLSLHMVFTGNPGTGKTTVARLIAKIFRALSILEKGHLVETDRSGLVGQYVGHTAVKTSEMIQKALDGMLFIDEAYSLYKDSENDFGMEAIDTLVKCMEDYRDRLVVIIAGYPEQMEDLIEANPGLRSRFNTYVNFVDYKPEELVQIFEILCRANEYELEPAAVLKLQELFAHAIRDIGAAFGNGRYSRNLFEKVLRNQALRLSNQKGTLSREDLVTITARDFAFCE